MLVLYIFSHLRAANVSTSSQLMLQTSDVTLLNSISLVGVKVEERIGRFSGRFNGNNHTLRDYRSSNPLIYICQQCVIEHVTFDNFRVQGAERACIVEYAINTTFHNVEVINSVFDGRVAASSLVYLSGSTLNISRATITNVRVSAPIEGGIFVYGTFTQTVSNTIMRLFMSNGGAVCHYATQFELRNSHISITFDPGVNQTVYILAVNMSGPAVFNASDIHLWCQDCASYILAEITGNSQSVLQINDSLLVIRNSSSSRDDGIFYIDQSTRGRGFGIIVEPRVGGVHINGMRDNLECSYILVPDNNTQVDFSQASAQETNSLYIDSDKDHILESLSIDCQSYNWSYGGQGRYPVSESLLRRTSRNQLDPYENDGTGCADSWTGYFCDVCPYMISLNGSALCRQNVSGANGDCVYVNTTNYVCNTCYDGYRLWDGDGHCYPECEACHNGGVCGKFSVSEQKFYCQCESGYTQNDNCQSCADAYGMLDGKCVPLVQNMQGTCYMSDGTVRCLACRVGYVLRGNACVARPSVGAVVMVALAAVLAAAALAVLTAYIVLRCKSRRPARAAGAGDARWQHRGGGAAEYGDVLGLMARGVTERAR